MVFFFPEKLPFQILLAFSLKPVSHTFKIPQLDTIQTKKGIADCNVDNKNNHSFLFWKFKSQYFIPILVILCVNFTLTISATSKLTDWYLKLLSGTVDSAKYTMSIKSVSSEIRFVILNPRKPLSNNRQQNG